MYHASPLVTAQTGLIYVGRPGNLGPNQFLTPAELSAATWSALGTPDATRCERRDRDRNVVGQLIHFVVSGRSTKAGHL